MRRRVAPAALALAVLAPAVPATAVPSRSQALFRGLLLEDRRTAADVKALLRDGGGFVDPSIAFRDVTGDERSDAVVRVNSGGASGTVAFYVFSTHGRKRTAPLRAIYRRQTLLRGFTRVRGGVLTYRTAVYAAGDEPDAPSNQVETTLEWDEERDRFVVAARRDVPAESSAPPAR